MLSKNLSRYVDIAFCFVLLPAMIMLLPLDRWLEDNTLYVVLLLTGLYAIYWVNRLVVVPSLFKRDRKFATAITFLLCSIFTIFLLSQYRIETKQMRIPRTEQHNTPNNSLKPAARRKAPPQPRLQQQATWFLFVVVLSFSTVVALLSELYRQSLYQQSVEYEKKKAELALYKAQINPHFLFNTLNTLLGMVITKSAKTEEAFVQFSTLMRYMYSNSDKDMIPLQTELEYITQYIELQRYRLSDNTQINISLCDEAIASQYQIAPMLLITFVENALKYGVSPSQSSEINIDVTLEDGVMHLTSINPIFATSSSSSKGIGIANCRSRLELLYRNNYTLIIKEIDNTYFVSLTIKLS